MKKLPLVFAGILATFVLVGLGYWLGHQNALTPTPAAQASSQADQILNASTPSPLVSESPAPGTSPTPGASPSASGSPSPVPTAAAAPAPAPKNGPIDLGVDANGLSHSTVTIQTGEGTIRIKLYSQDAPNTVHRFAELVQKGFYNGLTFHRVVPGFVIQGGDPLGNGTGGSGQRLKAEFNSRKHVEGAVAMARAADPDSADSQFYISLGTHPHLDHNYTVFGQVIEGMDVVRKIKIGDKMTSVTIN